MENQNSFCPIFNHRHTRHLALGASYIEVVIIATIIAVLLTVFLALSFRGQLGKANDAKRRDDLYRVKTAFEDYYNDRGCYPPADILTHCQSTLLQPYLERIPCDPITGEPYLLITEDSSCPSWYIIFAKLQNPTAFSTNPCRDGCTLQNEEGQWETYYYAVSSDNTSPQQYLADTYGCGEGCFILDRRGVCNWVSSCETKGDVKCYTNRQCAQPCLVQQCSR